ncbi:MULTISPECIES: thioredoxin-disulfide reductase [unclassified Halanaerobium]|uniref:thioredoxin-disulfide reductase n=1 Tax=unclassified Halanaerobium TaxID=2641197 RepID=UPI000DF2E7A0|nr:MULTISPECIES: thioredoxin-disulfide reductase [unclassified Halanaerobium]RCW50718.1 thioredoxin reductase (NADPH) [Halanaerobium sp. MA284_MarDTE_T2]RCW86886.1 thioredoxin reductase (NADPH) [Halanaerobium sp. DL-01]
MSEENRKEEKLIIIGGGPAGLSAAIYAARGGLDPLVINGPEPGGQITTTSELENYPGFPGGIGGFELMQKITEQAESFDARLVYEIVESVNFSGDSYIIKTDMEEYIAESVIIATGAEPRQLGLEKEDKFRGNGISYCATCDAAFFRDQDIAIVGGGDTALWEATFLTKFASKVYVLHRRDKFRGTKILGDRVKNNEKIEVLWNTEVKELLGENKLQGIKIFNNKNREEKDLGVSGLFIAVGHTPRTKLFKDIIKLDEQGYIITDEKQQTSIKGVYAAGDVQDPEYRQVIIAAASGAKAAIQAGKYLDNKN